jgi:hypothetical protein
MLLVSSRFIQAMFVLSKFQVSICLRRGSSRVAEDRGGNVSSRGSVTTRQTNFFLQPILPLDRVGQLAVRTVTSHCAEEHGDCVM